MRAPEVQRGLSRAGFVSTRTVLDENESRRLRELAAQVWRSLSSERASSVNSGLLLGALLSAHALGLADAGAIVERAGMWLGLSPIPEQDRALAPYVASLLALRQARPDLAAAVGETLRRVVWPKRDSAPASLGSSNRLAVFLRVALRHEAADAWFRQTRGTMAVGPVHVLAPADAEEQLLSGLWLDERGIVTGASAAQLAYARRDQDFDSLSFALLVEHFPAVAAARLTEVASLSDALERARVVDRAALLIALGNFLAPGGGVRGWTQQDPVVVSGRAAIREFGEAVFGPSTSLVARRELAGPVKNVAPREAQVRRTDRPPQEWDWQIVDGLSFLDSTADIQPGDPAVSMRFAFAWDDEALQFNAEVIDTPPGTVPPERRREAVEVLLDPQGDGFTNDPQTDRAYSFLSSGAARDIVRRQPTEAEITRRSDGYSIRARLPWERVGLKPAPGIRLGATASVHVSGPGSSRPAIKLTWRRLVREDGSSELGTLMLVP
jgi:hypothetical protein